MGGGLGAGLIRHLLYSRPVVFSVQDKQRLALKTELSIEIYRK
jgi:hypothetical protein